MTEKDKKAELDDLELVRRGMQSAQTLGAIQPGLGLNIEPVQAASAPENPESAAVSEEEEQRALATQALFKEGYGFLAAAVREGAVEGEFSASSNTEPVNIDEIKIPKDAAKLIGDPKAWLWILGSNSALQGNCQFSDDVLLNFYEIASALYNDKAHDKAYAAFTCLVHLNPLVSSFWVGKGLALEGLQRFDEAVDALENALLAAPSDFEPLLAIMRCSEELNDFTRVSDLLEDRKDVESMKEEVATALAIVADKTR